MEPSIPGMTLSIGDDLGTDVVPDCCNGPMTPKSPDPDGYRDHSCDTCGTTLTVSPNGLVFDICD